jgi:hypothetical protein
MRPDTSAITVPALKMWIAVPPSAEFQAHRRHSGSGLLVRSATTRSACRMSAIIRSPIIPGSSSSTHSRLYNQRGAAVLDLPPLSIWQPSMGQCRLAPAGTVGLRLDQQSHVSVVVGQLGQREPKTSCNPTQAIAMQEVIQKVVGRFLLPRNNQRLSGPISAPQRLRCGTPLGSG